MKTITRDMMKNYNIHKLGYDFMGYTFDRREDLSFHHLVVPKRDCKAAGLGEGYLKWNGAILNQNTSHDYLHIIERMDRDTFLRITAEMVEENLKGKLDIDNLKRIRELLLYFEDRYEKETNSKGQLILKRKFITKRIDIEV